jgi:zinc/manganese transport system substrate-binding protein
MDGGGLVTQRRSGTVWLATSFLALLLMACGTEPEPAPAAENGAPVEDDEQTLQVVATTAILGDIAANVFGEAGEVEVLMGPGVDPHQFEASAAQALRIREADLVIANGLELELRLRDVLESAQTEGAEVFYLFEAIDSPLDVDEAHHDQTHDGGHDHAHDDEDDEHAHDHEHGEWDPHVWFDPVRTAEAVRALGERLAQHDDSRPAGFWPLRAETYAEEILAAHEEIEEVLADVPPARRKLVTNHEAFGYFADRYGFDVVGVIIPGGATLAEPTAREFRALADTIREHELQAIFAETTSPTRLAEALAAEVGRDVEVVVLYSESLGEPGSGAETYLDMLRVNAERIAAALGG